MTDGVEETATVLIALADDEIASAAVRGVESSDAPISAKRVDPTVDDLTGRAINAVSGLIMDGTPNRPSDVIDRIGTEHDIPIAFLATEGDDETVSSVIKAGVDDVLPQTAAPSQYALAVETLITDSVARNGTDGDDHGPKQEDSGLYESLVEQSPNGVMIVQDTQVKFVNDRMTALTGSLESDLLGQRFYEIVTDDYRDLVKQRYERRIEGEDPPGRYEIAIRTESGGRRTIDLCVSKIRYRGAPATLATFNDITEQRRREREQQETQRRLRLIADHIDEIIYVATADFSEIQYINPAYEELYGRSVEELIDNPRAFVDAAHPDDRERYEADIEQVISDIEAGDPEGVYEGQYRIKGDDETRWVSVSRSPVENDDGTVDQIVGRVQDITERKRREHEYEQIFNGVQDAILVMDPDSLEILDANETYLDLLGYESLETIQTEGVEGISLADQGYTFEEGQKVHRRVAETGEPELIEWQGETKDGKRLYLEIKVAPAVINGRDVNVAIHRDTTERRLLERRFRTIAERVEEIIYLANADLTEVLYVNEAYADVFGRSTEILDDKPRAFLDGIHPNDRDTYETELEAMLEDIQTGDPQDRYEFEYRVERPDGDVRWVEQTGYPILSETDAPHRFVGVTKDVTERHRREQTLETFHEATRELTAADSRDVACRHAVHAAEDVLGFPLVSVYLYDDGAGTLEPIATTDRLNELDVEVPSFGPGQSVPWQVFVEGDPISQSDPDIDVYGPGISGPDIVLPLGSHGVMLVGSPTDTFGTEDVELAQILAATLEAALNHVADERELADREEELRRQRERARQLEQLNAIIRDIEQATVEQTSRAGIEEAVCERLTDAARTDLVWIGKPGVGDGRLSPHANAGGNDAYLDALTVNIDSDVSTHPAVAAYRDGETHVVENVATDVTTGEWRKTALRHGIQSVVSVPIQYGTATHGILTVAASEPDSFDEATRDVLAELGRSIGYAITVAEREEALESEGTTEIEFSIEDDGLFMVRAATDADCRIGLERTIRRSGGSFSMVYLVENADPSDIVALADVAPSVDSAQVISTDEDDANGLIEVTAPSWFGSVFTVHGAVVREATVENESGTLVVEAPRGADIRTIVEGFQERYPDTDLIAQRQRERTIRSLFELQDLLREELTDRQWESLETAYSAGYFRWPREVSGEEVADLIDVTQPTFNKHLRFAEQTAFRMLLDQGYSDSET